MEYASDEEPEIVNADFAFVPTGKFFPAGSAKVVGIRKKPETEPFPAYSDHFEEEMAKEEERKKLAEAQALTRTWVNSQVPSPTRVPLPTSPNSPFTIAPIRSGVLSSSPSASRMPLPTSPTSPFSSAPIGPGMSPYSLPPPPHFVRLPMSPYAFPDPNFVVASRPAPRFMPLRTSSTRSPSARPAVPQAPRQHCVQGGHVFRCFNLHSIQDTAQIGCLGASPYAQTRTEATQHVDVSLTCEKCNDPIVHEYSQCQVQPCGLVVCSDCGTMMQDALKRRNVESRV
ncbi:hypothetical protein BU23DRAFT_93173 [Bimuria novae-zelandiae CBS 107.79]|uniref:Uncharacterized protein n=1 Tax=Bimuria novae-zelandiae CBS 107.79 TaxID=1447943 RepID=A0A6A5VDZ3_9PLEO|nr:hypothetical protein BU23DRAFT_93173 [Bimuria novae-zelandiae CBS 107.79]